MEALAKREEQQNTASGATGGATGGAPGISRQKQRSKKYKGMSQKDIEIAQRLEKLKESSKQRKYLNPVLFFFPSHINFIIMMIT